MKKVTLVLTTIFFASQSLWAQNNNTYSEKVSKAINCQELHSIKNSMNKSYADIRQTSAALIKLDSLIKESNSIEKNKDASVKGLAYGVPLALFTIFMTAQSLNHKGKDFGDSEWRGTKYLMGFFALASTALSAFGTIRMIKENKKQSDMQIEIQKLKAEEAVLLKDLNAAKSLLNQKAQKLYCQI